MIQVLLYAFLYFIIINNFYRQETAQIISFPLIYRDGDCRFCRLPVLYTLEPGLELCFALPGPRLGTFISPNNLAGFLEMLLPLALAYVLVGRMKPVVRILLGYAVLVMLAGMVVTFSRGGWVAVAVALLALLVSLTFHRNHACRLSCC